jgi:hypothetical protein
MSRLDAALSLLIPGKGRFPAAGTLGLAGMVSGEPRFAGAVAAIMAAAEGLEALPPVEATALLRRIEAAHPQAFASFVVAAYSAYYTHPEVLSAIEAETGYKAGPPQPGGYALDRFDPAMLAVPAARPPQWRDPREVDA